MTDREPLKPCPSCGHKPSILFSSTAGWVVMCLRWNCEHPARSNEPGPNQGDVVAAWNRERQQRPQLEEK